MVRIKKQSDQKGFTLIEMILTITLLGILSLPLAYAFTESVRDFSVTADQVRLSQDARQAMQVIKEDLVSMSQGGVSQLTAHSIHFQSKAGTSTNYQLTGTTLQQGNLTLLTNVQNFDLTFYDQNGAITQTPGQVRRIRVSLGVNSPSNNNTVTISTDVFPRYYIYQQYQ